jgi:hypothetical protein
MMALPARFAFEHGFLSILQSFKRDAFERMLVKLDFSAAVFED